MSLTDVKIRNARATGKTFKLSDSDGLYLEVRPTGAKIWRYRFYLPNGKDSRYTIGDYPGVSLSDARAERDRVRELVRRGINPTAARRDDEERAQAEAANTFKTVALEWIEKKRPTWTEGTHQQVKSFLAINCYPAFGDKPIRDVTAHEILTVLRGMEQRGSVSSALKVRQWCSAIFCYAVATLRAESDPAAALKGAVIPQKVENSRCLTHDELRKYFAAASVYTGHPQTRLCLLLLPFLFVRQGELRNGRWEEMDWQDNLWTIPGKRMKMNRPHSVPLTATTRRLFEKLYALSGDKELMFPGIKKPLNPLSDSTVNRAIEYLGFPSKQITTHDFRATASTTLYEAGFRREVIEKQLAHAESNRVVAAYNHAEYLKERREMMEFYDAWLTGFMPGNAGDPDT